MASWQTFSLLFALVALSGCSGGDDDVAEATNQGTAGQSAGGNAGASGQAGAAGAAAGSGGAGATAGSAGAAGAQAGGSGDGGKGGAGDAGAAGAGGDAGAGGGAGQGGAAGEGGASGGSGGAVGGAGGSVGGAGGSVGGAGGGAGVLGPMQVGGATRQAAHAQGLVYVPTGKKLVIWDASASPTIVGTSELFDGMVSAVAVKGKIAYVAEQSASGLDGSLRVLDVSKPDEPVTVATIAYSNDGARNPTALLVEGDVLYAADTEAGLVAFDIADPASPKQVAQATIYGINHLAHDQGRLYAMSTSFVGATLYACSLQADKIEQVSSWPIPTVSPLAMAVSGGTFVIADVSGTFVYTDGGDGQLTELFHDESVRARTVAFDGARAYLPSAAGLYAVDLAAQPPGGQIIAADPSHRAASSAVEGGRLLVLTESSQGAVFDVSKPSGATLEGQIDIAPVAPHGGALAAGKLFVGDFYTGLRVVDAATLETVGRLDPTAQASAEEPLVAIEDVTVEGDMAYMVDWFGALVAIDVSTPSSPKLRSVTALPGEFPSAVAASGTWVYVAESTNDSFLRVFDASDPAKLVSRGSLPVLHAVDVEVAGSLVLVADQASGDPTAGGLLIVDVSDPDAPKQIGSYNDGCSDSTGVSVEGTTAAVGCGGEVHLLDISDPSKPTRISTFALPSLGSGAVLLRGDSLYASDSIGLTELDVSDKTQPKQVRFVSIARPARGLFVGPQGRLLVSASEAGLLSL